MGEVFTCTEVPMVYDPFSEFSYSMEWTNASTSLMYICHRNKWSHDLVESVEDSCKNILLPIEGHTSHDLHKLCYEGQEFFALEDALSFFSHEFNIKKDFLKDSLIIDQNSSGWCCHLDAEMATSLDLEGP